MLTRDGVQGPDGRVESRAVIAHTISASLGPEPRESQGEIIHNATRCRRVGGGGGEGAAAPHSDLKLPDMWPILITGKPLKLC